MRWISPLLLAVALAGRPAAAAGDEAPLPVLLEGEPALVAEIGEGLGRRGIATAAVVEGDAVRVVVARAGDGITLAVRDPQGRTFERLVATADTAAALIESWARPAIAEPLLAPRRPVIVTPPALHEQAAPAPAAATDSLAPWTPRLRVSAETSADVDRTWWLGASAGVCGRVGPLCLGAEARFARLFQESWDLADRRLMVHTDSRSDWSTLFTAELPIALGRPVLIVGLGLGLGRRSDGGFTAVAPRSELRAGLALPLWSQLAIDFGLTATLDPRSDDAGLDRARPADGHLRAGIGLRWGMP